MVLKPAVRGVILAKRPFTRRSVTDRPASVLFHSNAVKATQPPTIRRAVVPSTSCECTESRKRVAVRRTRRHT